MNAMSKASHVIKGAIKRVERYGWKVIDTPGRLAMVDVNALEIDPSYQRPLYDSKVLQIASAWSWKACGALTIGYRNETFYVMDGQHRLSAAKRRGDIHELPCIVFDTESSKEEAAGFVQANTFRKPVSAVAKHNARVVAGDEVAMILDSILGELDLSVVETASKSGHIKCVNVCYKYASTNYERLLAILKILKNICHVENKPIPQSLLCGLWLIEENNPGTISDARFLKIIEQKGYSLLFKSAFDSAAYAGSQQPKFWARGILDEVNKRIHHKFGQDA